MISSPANGRRPYVRSMKDWWRRNPFYIEYMLHEGTALLVAAYALVLLIGLLRLSQGEAAWDAWLRALSSPLSIGFHVIILVAVTYHAWTWFNIMPRTLPPMRLNGKRLPAAVIVYGGLTAVLVVSLLLVWLAWRLGT
ncbi:MAG TPA: fumarate reductase subunit C [Gammaproteobacteria bacterium]